MQTYRAQASRFISAQGDDLWNTIKSMEGMEDWYPGLIASSRVDGSPDQPTRMCTMHDGEELHERIMLRDQQTHTFVYAIDRHPLPATNLVGTIRVDPMEGGSQVTWDAQFTAAPAQGEHVTSMISDIYTKGLDSLAAYHNQKGQN